jgi:hypothetical protein
MMHRPFVDPSPKAYTAEPLTPVEIDAHPDCDRIWATIMALTDQRHEDHDYAQSLFKR